MEDGGSHLAKYQRHLQLDGLVSTLNAGGLPKLRKWVAKLEFTTWKTSPADRNFA